MIVSPQPFVTLAFATKLTPSLPDLISFNPNGLRIVLRRRESRGFVRLPALLGSHRVDFRSIHRCSLTAHMETLEYMITTGAVQIFCLLFDRRKE